MPQEIASDPRWCTAVVWMHLLRHRAVPAELTLIGDRGAVSLERVILQSCCEMLPVHTNRMDGIEFTSSRECEIHGAITLQGTLMRGLP